MKTDATNYDYIFKVLLLGDSSVGKTCFLLRFSDDTFTDNHISTIGLDYRLKMVSVNESVIKLQIWDTAGQDRFRAITKNYYKGAHGIILLYDVTNTQSFNNIKNWISQIKENTTEKVKICLVGNKCDMDGNRKILYEDGEKLAEENGIKFIETSAKNNLNVEETFKYLIEEIYSYHAKEKESEEKPRERRRSFLNLLTLTSAANTAEKSKKKKCCKDS
jgi:Ras-related protein Rab-1A